MTVITLTCEACMMVMNHMMVIGHARGRARKSSRLIRSFSLKLFCLGENHFVKILVRVPSPGISSF